MEITFDQNSWAQKLSRRKAKYIEYLFGMGYHAESISDMVGNRICHIGFN